MFFFRVLHCIGGRASQSAEASQKPRQEFVNGCIRLQGPAKAIDLATLMHEYRRRERREFVRHNSVARAIVLLLRSHLVATGVAAKEDTLCLMLCVLTAPSLAFSTSSRTGSQQDDPGPDPLLAGTADGRRYLDFRIPRITSWPRSDQGVAFSHVEHAAPWSVFERRRATCAHFDVGCPSIEVMAALSAAPEEGTAPDRPPLPSIERGTVNTGSIVTFGQAPGRA